MKTRVSTKQMKFKADLPHFRKSRPDILTVIQLEGDLCSAEMEAVLLRIFLLRNQRLPELMWGSLLGDLGISFFALDCMWP